MPVIFHKRRILLNKQIPSDFASSRQKITDEVLGTRTSLLAYGFFMFYGQIKTPIKDFILTHWLVEGAQRKLSEMNRSRVQTQKRLDCRQTENQKSSFKKYV